MYLKTRGLFSPLAYKWGHKEEVRKVRWIILAIFLRIYWVWIFRGRGLYSRTEFIIWYNLCFHLTKNYQSGFSNERIKELHILCFVDTSMIIYCTNIYKFKTPLPKLTPIYESNVWYSLWFQNRRIRILNDQRYI